MGDESQEVVQEVQKAKGWVPYLVSLLISLGVVGGGGTVGVGVIQNDLEHTNSSLAKIEEVVGDVQKNVQTSVKELQEKVAQIAPVVDRVDRLREQIDDIDDRLDKYAPRGWVAKLQERVNELREQVTRLEVQVEKLRN